MHGWFHTDWWMKNIAKPLDGGQFDPEHATSSTALALRSTVVQIFYAIGVLSCVLSFVQRPVDDGHHLGHLDFAGRAAPGQLRMRRALALLLAAVSMGALFGMTRRPTLTEAQAVEAGAARTTSKPSSNKKKPSEADSKSQTQETDSQGRPRNSRPGRAAVACDRLAQANHFRKRSDKR